MIAVKWRDAVGQAFAQGGLRLYNNTIIIPQSGLYFVYSQASFSVSCSKNTEGAWPSMALSHRIWRASNSIGQKVSLMSGVRSACQNVQEDDMRSGHSCYSTIYLGAVFQLNKGDKLETETNQLPELDTEEGKTFFGVTVRTVVTCMTCHSCALLPNKVNVTGRGWMSWRRRAAGSDCPRWGWGSPEEEAGTWDRSGMQAAEHCVRKWISNLLKHESKKPESSCQRHPGPPSVQWACVSYVCCIFTSWMIFCSSLFSRSSCLDFSSSLLLVDDPVFRVSCCSDCHSPRVMRRRICTAGKEEVNQEAN
ncbi:hypothetical protein XENOCAPTIV_030858 [Xenoophorus captivus]|uniref:Lymphotoxin-alpha n=1 Tax=Xenoophorus captivus TaxID=1517983 RepID=A0ABV0Q7P9_9TELE